MGESVPSAIVILFSLYHGAWQHLSESTVESISWMEEKRQRFGDDTGYEKPRSRVINDPDVGVSRLAMPSARGF